MKKIVPLVGVLMAVAALGAACRKARVPADILEPPLDPPLVDHQWEVVLDATLLKAPSPDADKVSEVKRGQYVRVLEIRDVPTPAGNGATMNMKWYKVYIEDSGLIGWVNQDAVSMMKHAATWSSDTKPGDQLARRIFLDKLFFDKPLKHVRVWTRYHLVVLWFDRAVPMDPEIATRTLYELNREWQEACEAKQGYENWELSCRSPWPQKGRWVIIGWDNQGLYRFLLPFGKTAAEAF